MPGRGLWGRRLRAVKALAARCHGLKGSCRFSDLGFLVQPHLDPELESCCKVVGWFCDEVWQAPGRAGRDRDVVPLGVICLGLEEYLKRSPAPISNPTTIFSLYT